ncbi:MAG: nitroreductase [Ruminococcus sp.]|nr:nitroreductase [Ruminococcus sp.]
MILYNEIVDCILSRRSIRSYARKSISTDALETILEAGRYAPSGMNHQSVKVIVIQSSQNMIKLVSLAKKISGIDRNPFYEAPTVILVFGDSHSLTLDYDGATAIENMFLAAHSLGIGTCWIYAVTAIFANVEGKAWQKEIGMPENYKIIGSIAMGYTDSEILSVKPRKDDFYIII